ncbi:hypothetical protein HELRODRAFT_72329 [Helobdella robusta]|uniref:Protein xylosyltransferase n=1 Tax=Helobdella robusta TaxID=6412 RepID=T1G0Y4_HELRO|nr:hypothetical protein HELRODRAFT_72329 [Helobdella robusta]ESO10805.1 hypothetical protein HELRODRAFT_72329 [Helobdella robusta]
MGGRDSLSSSCSKICPKDICRANENSNVKTPLKRVRSVNCFALMEGEEEEIRSALQITNTNASDEEVVNDNSQLQTIAADCDQFKGRFGYNYYDVTNVETDFPIAYSIVFHKNPAQLERLLRNIYRRHNAYCIHVDLKASSEVYETVKMITECFDNVFLSKERVNVIYASFARLQADLICMSELLDFKVRWKYVINLTGQMFPLKTNLEIVRILESLKGSNDIESFSWGYSLNFNDRFKYVYKIINNNIEQTKELKEKPPFHIRLQKGSVFGSFKKEFVRFVFMNSRVRVFLKWLQDVYSPDEFFWATINNRLTNPIFNAPGYKVIHCGYNRASERVPWLSTFVSWAPPSTCSGKIVRSYCIFGIGDLQSLVYRNHLFANKFYIDYQTLTIDCLEEWLHNKTVYKPLLPMHMFRENRYFL